MSDRMTLDIVRKLYDDSDGDWLEVGPDRDGLDLVELSHKTGNPADGQPALTMTPKKARIVAKMLIACATELETRGAEDGP